MITTNMINTILAKKGKNSQVFVDGARVPVTKMTAGPVIVTQIKGMDKDGYNAVQLGFSVRRIKNTSKPLRGHLKAATKDNKSPRFLREVRLTEEPNFQVGDEITITKIFRKGDVIAVTGVSKGKGFAGGVKRHGFRGGPKTHGQSDRHRAPGSIGQGTTPGRVLKGKRMAGRMGHDTVTVKNLMVVDVNTQTHELAISGALPGNPGTLLYIRRISAGNLDDLVEEVPQVEVQEEAPAEETPAEGGQA
jgi:large subunit ribosomal protein L3